MQVRAATAEERNALADRLGCSLTREARGIVAVDSAGEMRGGVLYDLWTDSSVQCHMVTDSPIVWRSLLPAVFQYPFIMARKQTLIGAIRSSNIPSLRMVQRLGFTEAARVPDGFAQGDDLVLVYMRREDCRYLRRN
jgi:L-amino acid N-acyltransferase YncA